MPTSNAVQRQGWFLFSSVQAYVMAGQIWGSESIGTWLLAWKLQTCNGIKKITSEFSVLAF